MVFCKIRVNGNNSKHFPGFTRRLFGAPGVTPQKGGVSGSVMFRLASLLSLLSSLSSLLACLVAPLGVLLGSLGVSWGSLGGKLPRVRRPAHHKGSVE